MGASSSIQTVQGEQHNPIINVGTSISQELSRLNICTKDHPPNQVIRNLNDGVQTRFATNIQNKCHLSEFISVVEPKFIKDSLEYFDWIIAM